MEGERGRLDTTKRAKSKRLVCRIKKQKTATKKQAGPLTDVGSKEGLKVGASDGVKVGA